MSDWGDEETTEVIGKGFGNNNDNYKSNHDDDYQNEDDENNNDDGGYKKRFNGGGGGGRGRNGGGRGGGRNGGNGFNRYNRDNDGNDDNDGENNGYGGGERRGGFGGGRGRGGGRGGGGRDGGRREFNNNKGESDEHNNSGGGGDGGEGDEPKKPREFYIPPEPTDNEEEIFGTGITSGINFSKYDSIPVKVTGENAPASIQTFEEANLRDIVINNIKRSGYKIPTPIQKTAIPVITAGRDLMACAQTGSGKTAAFLLPIINSLLSEGAETSIGKPHALIVSPTRELAIQIFNEARKFAMGSYLNIRIVYGGTSSKHQGENIGRGGSHILICTPGRLLDFVEKGFITFEDTRFVVLDEADRMLDMGFKESMATIMNHPTMRPMEERQNLMFSATFPAEIQRMAGEYLNEYIFISIGVVGGACSDVTQNIYEVKKFQKRSKLMELLQENPDGTIVFVETKRGADFLASLLSETEFPTTSIHGDRLQSQREMALADFKNGKMKVLIATSVAARGLDIKNVNHVVNYDMPSSIDEYVHRIGRTGRVGNNGRATSFFDPESDSAIAADLVNILEGAGQEVPDFLKNFSGGGGGGGSYGSKFGGRDVRKGVPQTDDNFVTSSGPSALEEEEEWN
ncbi:ATP-dependent RNA helicase vasa [Lucilia sericata]|uniref:ATP-dependent RNA helicase vasa n=1 Tax=Lucilia sericata TaxID=13632 RepID=UPI0018A8039F|nr:ATP-dependent RNA helicase vasa [Lucilia sericata]XP_037823765.1 ATP-dependent RNA helicase vasa [Lucilia sericata]